MFSYTDDAIVTSSPTGRHLSTVIRRPAAIGPLDWSEHADQVCKVLNELDRNAKLNYQVSYSLGAGHFQTVGRVYRTGGGAYLGPFPVAPAGEQGAKLDWAIHYPVGMADIRQGPKAADQEREENLALRREVERLKRQLAAEQMPVELPIETAALRVLLENVGTGSLLHCKAPCGRTVIIKRVE